MPNHRMEATRDTRRGLLGYVQTTGRVSRLAAFLTLAINMMDTNSTPFTLDATAAKFMADAVRHAPKGTVAGLWTGCDIIERDKTRQITAHYRGEHWFVGYDDETHLRQKGFTDVKVAGMSFMIE